MAETEKTVPMYLFDFESNGETRKETLALKSAFIKEYGLPAFEQLVSRSIRKQNADRHK